MEGQIKPYEEGDIARVLAGTELVTSDVAELLDAGGEVDVGDILAEVETDKSAQTIEEAARREGERPFRVRPVIPEALFVTNMVRNERERIAAQLHVTNEDLDTVLRDIAAANAELAAINARLRDLGKKRDNIVEDIADLERADAICDAALRKADEASV